MRKESHIRSGPEEYKQMTKAKTYVQEKKTPSSEPRWNTLFHYRKRPPYKSEFFFNITPTRQSIIRLKGLLAFSIVNSAETNSIRFFIKPTFLRSKLHTLFKTPCGDGPNKNFKIP
jgi:hypothetical protein